MAQSQVRDAGSREGELQVLRTGCRVGLSVSEATGLLARLLQKVLSLTVRNGTLRVTPVGAPAFTVGDGTGPLLALRFTSRAAELGMLPAIERSGLLATDVEILRLRYARTLEAWRERFRARREEAEQLYDARFCRMWEFYLAAAEMAFRHQGMMVFQIQLTRRQGVVPTTRDYIMREEARLRGIESGHRPPLRLAGE